jgi:hypothetical protein
MMAVGVIQSVDTHHGIYNIRTASQRRRWIRPLAVEIPSSRDSVI